MSRTRHHRRAPMDKRDITNKERAIRLNKRAKNALYNLAYEYARNALMRRPEDPDFPHLIDGLVEGYTYRQDARDLLHAYGSRNGYTFTRH